MSTLCDRYKNEEWIYKSVSWDHLDGTWERNPEINFAVEYVCIFVCEYICDCMCPRLSNGEFRKMRSFAHSEPSNPLFPQLK